MEPPVLRCAGVVISFWVLTVPILCVAVQHIVQVLILLAQPSAGTGTGILSMLSVIGDPLLLSGALLISTACALFAAFGRAKRCLTASLLLLPQQFFLLVAAIGAFATIVTGEYLSGVIRPHFFIVADQLPRILITIIHGTSIYGLTKTRWR